MPVAPSSDAPTPATISVVGTASQYPSNQHEPEFLPQLSKRHYAHSSALEKTLEIHMRTKIEKRYSVLPDTHPLWHQDKVPTVTECIAISEQYGLPLAKAAAKEAIAEWGGDIQGITHVIAVTCSGGSSPRFDSALCKHLGMSQHARRILIDGMTCAGSVAALRTAYELLLGATCVGQPGRALVIACETMSIYNRAWLDHIVTQQTPNLAPTLFGDCSSAVVLSNMIGVKDTERPPIWQIIGAQPTLTTVSGVIGDNIVPTGHIPAISKEAPKVVESGLPSAFHDLIESIPALNADRKNYEPATYDWALHPGGYAILTAAERALGITAQHLRYSYERYRTAGNTASATVFSILDQMARENGVSGRARVIAAALGADVTLELMVLERVER